MSGPALDAATAAGPPGGAAPPSAVRAFGAAADDFDARFGDWASVAAQRRAVRRHLLAAFPPGARLLELGAGTGDDALFMAQHGRTVVLTDGAATMLERARVKAEGAGIVHRVRTERLVLEEIEAFARDWLDRGEAPFDGAYSNFAGLNCVPDLRPIACGLARLLTPGAPALLVLFGPLPPGEVLVQLLRGKPREAFRRVGGGPAPARLGEHPFTVWYPGPRRAIRSFAPEFRSNGSRGIGIFVPPSAAEPAISRRPRLLRALEALDRVTEAPLAWLGDHVLLRLERTAVPAPPTGGTAAREPAEAPEALRRFRGAYSAHREAEGRGSGGTAELLALPYLRSGPQAAQWAVRSRSFDRFLSTVLAPRAAAVAPRPLRVLDLGAGNAWLSYRTAVAGHLATAVDLRTDGADGLRAADAYRSHVDRMPGRVAGSFEALPLADDAADLAVFNASLHYAVDLSEALREAVRVLGPDGGIAILDSPFYRSEADGAAMVAEKRRTASARFGGRAADLMGPRFVEFLTPERLRQASAGLALTWRRHRVRYPLRYEVRPLIARLRGQRRPSRFDVWEGRLS